LEIFAETERLILREILSSDDKGMFELDSDAEVHKYLGNKPVETIVQSREMIEFIRRQYIENGIGRWAVIEKASNDFMGWAGLKLNKEPRNDHIDYYDVGYRFIKRYWGKGYATESAKPSLKYGFEKLKLNEIYGTADAQNIASKKVLEKLGLKYIETFEYYSRPTVWMKITKEEWSNIP